MELSQLCVNTNKDENDDSRATTTAATKICLHLMGFRVMEIKTVICPKMNMT